MKKVSDILAIKIIFFITACYVGLWVLRIPTIKDQLQTDYVGVTTDSKVLSFESSANKIIAPTSGFSASVNQSFTGISTNPSGNKVISLGVNFENGLANPEINKGSGDVIYLDNRPVITRNSRQKEDIKIILEF